jgi:hypothetical protein
VWRLLLDPLKVNHFDQAKDPRQCSQVSKALSVHVAPLARYIVVVPTGVTVLLGLHNPPRSWTGMVGPSQNLRCVYAFIQLHLSHLGRL